MEAIVEKITPELATKYLEMNIHNRAIRQRHVEFLAKEITDERWVLNGASIVFDGDTLVDGQHRLWAIITANKAIKSLVVRGVEQESFPTIDTGHPRTGGDVLSIADEKYPQKLATAARFIMDYHAGALLHRHERISNGSILDFVKQNSGLRDSATFIVGLKGTHIYPPAPSIALHYLMARKDPELANELFTGIYHGFKMSETDTFYCLREKMISCLKGVAKIPLRIVAIFIIKAWNAKRNGEKLSIFKFSEGDKIPKIK